MDGHQKFTDDFDEDRHWSGAEDNASPSPNTGRNGALADDTASIASAGAEADIDMSNVSCWTRDACSFN